MSSTRIDLPNGGWANLRAAEDVPERLRRPVEALTIAVFGRPEMAEAIGAAQSFQGDPKALLELPEDKQQEYVKTLGGSINQLNELNDAVVVARVKEWSYGPDVTLDRLLDLPGKVYTILRAACADGMNEMLPSFEPSQEENSPTGPSTASASQ